MKKYIIIHGSFGSNEGNWFPWLKSKLQDLGQEVVVPQMPVGVNVQNFESWSKVMDGLHVDENTIIIAHSIAPIFVCKYLIANKISVQKLIFVCGFNGHTGIDPDYDNVNMPMFIDTFEEVKKYCKDIVCFYSDNDPYVPYQKEKTFADKIANKQYIVQGGQHLNAESGFYQFPQILQEI